jgi:hypothetical protein
VRVFGTKFVCTLFVVRTDGTGYNSPGTTVGAFRVGAGVRIFGVGEGV